ncbi:MAG: hypothetical protein R3D78_06695 [Paracoccaceae bacterium]
MVLRLSGTGTEGDAAGLSRTLRAGPDGLAEGRAGGPAPIIAATEEIVGIRARTGRAAPDVIT